MATPIPRNTVESTARRIAEVTGGRIVRGEDAVSCGIVSDTRALQGGEAFVALHGEHHDGHAFLEQATRSGAAILVVDRECEVAPGPAVVLVDDTLHAWGALAQAHVARWRDGSADRRIVAITGSAGKTTTKQLSAALLAAVAPTHATAGNLNNLVGVPAVAFGLEPAHRFAVFECGMSVRGEIAALGAIVQPDVAAITNVSLAHAEGVGGTREDVAREKAALYAALRPGDGVCIFDADDGLTRDLSERCQDARRVGFGRAADASYRLIDRVPRGLAGSRVTFARPAGTITVELPFVGETAALDLGAALAAAESAAGALPEEAIIAAMKSVQNVAGRATIHELDRNIVVIDDSYNANPASVRAALQTLHDVGADRRLVAVLGEMKELGPTARALHVQVGEDVIEAGVSLLIGCGGLAHETVARARAGGVEAIDCQDVAEAARVAVERIQPGDIVLVKGSRSVGTERVAAALRQR